MRPPVFSANPFQREEPCCCRRHARCLSRMGDSRESPSPPSSPPSWPSAAAFIPIMLIGGPRSRYDPAQCRGDNNPCSRDDPAQCSREGNQRISGEEALRHFLSGGPQTSNSQPLPGFKRDCLPHPEISDAISLAQGLLGELFGHSANSSTEEKKQREEGGRQTAEKQPASQSLCSLPDHCSDKATVDSKGCASPKAQTTSSSSQEVEKDRKADEKAPTQFKGEEERSGKDVESSTPSSLWNHSLYFLRFNPNKVTAKLKDGKVHIDVAYEPMPGPGGSSMRKLEAKRVVELPPHVDTRTLTCTMRRDGTLDMQASITHPSLPQDSTPLTTEGKTPAPPQDTTHLTAEGKTPAPSQDTTHLTAEGKTPAPPQDTTHLTTEGKTPAPPQDTTHLTTEGKTPAPPQDTMHLTAEEKTPLPENTTPLSDASNPEVTAQGLDTMQHDAEMSPLKYSLGHVSCDRQQEGEEESLKGEHRKDEEEEQEDMEEDNEERMKKEDEEQKMEANSEVHKEEDEAERVNGSLPQKEDDSDCYQPMEEDEAQSPIPAEKEEALLRDGAQETFKLSHCAEDEEEAEDLKEEFHQQAETDGADNADQDPVTMAIIQEPESSDEEEALHNTTLSSQPSIEDFVVIDVASLSPDDTAEAIIKDGEGSESVDQTMIEKPERCTGTTSPFANNGVMDITQHAVDKGDMDITQHFADKEDDPIRPYDTDPTRPIKRSEGKSENTHQDCEPLHSTTPDQQPLLEYSDNTTTPASPHQNPPAAFRLSLPLVGFNAENVHVSLDRQTLHISATRQARAGDAPYKEHVQRELELPTHVDPMTVRCVYLQDQGSLLITAVATTAPAQLRTVPVIGH